MNAGHTSEWFTPTRGLHQGAPESPQIFRCVMEILGQNIHKNELIQGIKIRDSDIEIKSGQFADDTTLFSLLKADSSQVSIDTLVIFERNSSLKLNYDKSSLYHLGSLFKSNARLCTTKELNWTTEKVNMLGLEIEDEETVLGNYSSIVSRIKGTLHA